MSEQSVQELLSLAYEYHRAGQSADAEDLYKQILAEDPEQPDALYLLGILLFQSQRKQEAAFCLQRAAESHPDNVEILSSLGSVRVDLGDYDAAIPVLKTADGGRADESETTFAPWRSVPQNANGSRTRLKFSKA